MKKKRERERDGQKIKAATKEWSVEGIKRWARKHES